MRIGVALGSGAARGLAHVAYIEALDELGLKPSVIARRAVSNAMLAHSLRSGAAR